MNMHVTRQGGGSTYLQSLLVALRTAEAKPANALTAADVQTLQRAGYEVAVGGVMLPRMEVGAGVWESSVLLARLVMRMRERSVSASGGRWSYTTEELADYAELAALMRDKRGIAEGLKLDVMNYARDVAVGLLPSHATVGETLRVPAMTMLEEFHRRWQRMVELGQPQVTAGVLAQAEVPLER